MSSAHQIDSLESSRSAEKSPQLERSFPGWKSSRNGTSAGLLEDEFDEDEDITTPNGVRESSRQIDHNESQVRNEAFLFSRRSDPVDIPRTPTKNNASNLRQSSISSSQRVEQEQQKTPGREVSVLTPNRKLIGDDNELTPGPIITTLSPPRNDISRLPHLLLRPNDMEFDPSDRELPEKLGIAVRESALFTSSGPRISQNNVDATGKSNKEIGGRTDAKAIRPNQLPTRLSPLRNEIKSGSTTFSSVPELLKDLRNSSSLRPRTSEEIYERMHSSMLELEAADEEEALDSDGSMESSDSEVGSSEIDEIDDIEEIDMDNDNASEDLLSDLDQFLPPIVAPKRSDIQASPKHGSDEDRSKISPSDTVLPESVSKGNTAEEEENGKEAQTLARANLSKLSRIDVELLSNNGSPKSRLKKKRVLPTGKLSGKYARKVIKDKKLAGKKYPDWLQDQWDKLIRLVDLDVPNIAIINSPVVMRELKCKNKQELAHRVAFLSKINKKQVGKRDNQNAGER